MRETHPIDELFGRALRDAEAPPPPTLGAAIVARARRRRRALLWWRGGLAAALLMLVGAAGWWAMLADGTAPRQAGAPSAASRQESLPGLLPGSAAAAPAAGQHDVKPEPSFAEARTADMGERPGGGPEAPSLRRGTTAEAKGRTEPLRALQHRKPADASGVWNPATAGTPAAAQAPGRATEQGGTASVETAQRFRLSRLAALAPPPAAAASARLMDGAGQAYYRPRGWWWVGASATAQASRYAWRGGPPNLVRALEGSGAWSPGAAFGLVAGRAWPSGLSLALGVEADRWEQRYRHVDRREVEQVEAVVAQMVTLNSQVVFADYDTVVTSSTLQAVAEGAELRVRVRVPLELGWQHRFGRLLLGARAGVAAENASVRSSAGMAVDVADGLVRSRALSRAEWRARYPVSLSGVAGIDIGYALTERLHVVATPFLMRPIATFGAAYDAQALPHRTGARLMLQHRF